MAESDYWSLGLILFETLTGRFPFHEHDLAGLFGAIKAGRFLDPRTLNREISDGMCSLMGRLLQLDPAIRLSDPEEVVSLLLEELPGRPRGENP